MALVIGGVVIVIRNKDGSETKIEVPDGSTVTIDKDGKTVVVQPPGGNPAAVADPDRKATTSLQLSGVRITRLYRHREREALDGRCHAVRSNAI